MLLRRLKVLKTGIVLFAVATMFLVLVGEYFLHFTTLTFVSSFRDVSGFVPNVTETMTATQKRLVFPNRSESAAEETIPEKDKTSASESVEETTLQTHKTSLITTTSCEQEYFMLILVSSAPNNEERRKDIRVTWGVDYAIKPRWKTVFLVGQARTQLNSTRLAKEGAVFGDLVRADYYDHYWNQTLKVQMAFEWASKYCKFSFLLKVDDDVFVHTKALISYLSKPGTPTKKLYMGDHIKNPIVFRDGKWKVTVEEFSGPHYPDFCLGLGYVISADVAVIFVDLFDVVRNFRLDDVGMLAHEAGINITHVEGFNVLGPSSLDACTLPQNAILWHGVFGQCLLKVYDQLLKEAKEQSLNKD